MATDYIPSRDHERVAKLRQIATFTMGHAVVIGIGTSRATLLNDLVSDAETELAAHDNEQALARAQTQKKDDAIDLAVAEARSICQTAQNSPAMTPSLKEEMGIPVRDDSRSPVGVPSVEPGLAAQRFVGLNLLVRTFDPADLSRRAKTPGVALFQYFTSTAATPPADLSAWRLAATSGRTTATIPFPLTDAGKDAWVCCRALNAKGEAGPVGEPVRVTVAAAIAA